MEKTGGVDTSAGNAGARPAASRAASPAFYFTVDVKWHPPDGNAACENIWYVTAIRGDMFHLILEERSGLTVTIPLAYIERVIAQRLG